MPLEGENNMPGSWKIIASELAYKGYFKLVKYTLAHELFRGGEGKPIVREIFERGSAAAVLPYDPVRDEVLLVEQFRPGAIYGDGEPWLTELIAGIIEDGEAPEEVVRREAVEEAGIELQEVIPVTHYFVSPGGSTEEMHIFCARADLSGAGGIYGLADEGEDIRVEVLKSDDALALLDSGKLNNAMTIIGLQWFRQHRHSLFRD
jgi:ADP-ribose pyrophosphatase